MSHSHLSARHLIQQIESDRSARKKRDIRPAWLKAFIESAAESFEPLADVGRVGFDCRVDEQGWSIQMFLGTVEVVGGSDDGERRGTAFYFDVFPLLGRFSRIDAVHWTVLPAEPALAQAERSILQIEGCVEANAVRLAVHSLAPEEAGPGLRQLADGRMEVV